MKEIKSTYGNKVKVVFKNFPLNFHKDAAKAAEALTSVKSIDLACCSLDRNFLTRHALNSYLEAAEACSGQADARD